MRSILALILFAALLPVGIAPAQIRSAASGGVWSHPQTWEGGVVPGPDDDVVIRSGEPVTLTYAITESEECRSMTIEEGGTLVGEIGAVLVVRGDLLIQGTLRNAQDVNVLGSLQHHGEIIYSYLYVYGDVLNSGVWLDGEGGVESRLYLTGDQRRTVRAEGVDARITAGRSFLKYVDLIPPRIVLEGENYVPSFVTPDRGGDMVVVNPGATFEIGRLGGEVDLVYENEYWLFNYGRVVTHFPHESFLSEDAVIAHGGLFELTDPAGVGPLRLTTYGAQAPSGFPNAVRRWWRIEGEAPSETATYTDLTLYFRKQDLGELALESLGLYHSADGGETWREVEADFLHAREFPNIRGSLFIEVEANGSFPLTGDYTMAASAPAALRSSIRVDIVGRSQIRVGGPPAEYLIRYENAGSTPIYRGLLALETTEGVFIDRLVTSDAPGSDGNGVELTAQEFSLDGGNTSAMLITPELAPGEGRTLYAYLSALPVGGKQASHGAAHAPIEARAVLLQPSAGAEMGFGTRLRWLRDAAAFSLEEAVSDPCSQRGPLRDKVEEGMDRADLRWNPTRRSEAPWSAMLMDDQFTGEEQGLLATFSEAVVRGANRYEEAEGRPWTDPLDCDGDPDRWPPPGGTNFRLPLDPVSSFDPNAKIGPRGAGSAGFIRSGGTFTYQILFENLAEATAPAYRIVIVDTLGSEFDETTVQRTRESHEGFAFTRDGNILRWEIEGIELPPNVNPPEGEGFIEFTVETRPDLESGTPLRNRAEIVFDVNEPILTNEHVNTLDLEPPVTTMSPLEAVFAGDRLEVGWTSDDGENGSGAASTSVFISRDEGPFELLGTTPGVSMSVDVDAGHSYAFYALAEDAAGNAETKIPEPVRTSVSVSTEEDDLPYRFALHAAYPNPFNPSTSIAFELARPGEVELRIYNVLGQRVMTSALGGMTPGPQQYELRLPGAASGVYLYELRVTGEEGLLYRSVGKAVLLK